MFVIYLALWFIFNERVTLEVAIVGAIICVFIDLFTIKILGKIPHKKVPTRFRLLIGGISYAGNLIVEIFKSNLAVAKLILSPRLETEPELHTFKTSLKSDTARVVLANSITITPGTITCTLEDDKMCVHALDKSFADGIEHSGFEKRLKELEEIADES